MIPITRGIADTTAVTEWLGERYPQLAPKSCVLQRLSFHETYRVPCLDGKTCFLRVYAPDRRDAADIRYELELLDHLANRNAPAAPPLTDQKGEHLQRLSLPEGPRFAVLFAAARGERSRCVPTAEQTRQLAGAMARLHAASDDFRPVRASARPHRNLDFLLGGTLRYLDQHAEGLLDLTALRRDADTVRAHLEPLLPQLDTGVVHMDAHSGNCAFLDDAATFFDFDFAGPGYRIVDLLEPYYLARDMKQPELWDAALDGYRSQRALSEHNVAAIDGVLAAVLLWSLEINLHRARTTGLETADLPARVQRFHDAASRLAESR